jgi:drug/metabolite transporter (DMT)-like permease
MIGSAVFHERFGPPRILAAMLVASGILVLSVGP